MPMTPFIGVRISWLIVARNSDFARFAASAAASFCFSALMSRTIVSSPIGRPGLIAKRCGHDGDFDELSGPGLGARLERRERRALLGGSDRVDRRRAAAAPEVELAQRPSDRLDRAVAIQSARAPVPGGDDPALIVREDRVARLLDLEREQAGLLLAATQGRQK